VTLDDEAGELENEFTSLAHSKQWGVLVSKAETAISSEQDFEARLWWIRGHLGAFSLPVSLLAAPFETVCRQLHGRGDRIGSYRELVSEIGTIMLERLHGVGDRRQEHGVRHALTQLGLLSAEQGGAASRTKVPTLAPRFELGTPADSARVEDAPALQPPVKKGLRISWGLAAIVLALLTGGAYVYLSGTRFFEAQTVAASEPFMSSELVVAQISPEVSVRTGTGNLGALYYAVSESTPGLTQQARPPAPIGQTESAKVSGSARERLPAASDKPAPQSAGVKERVNTDGPVEGSEFQGGVENHGAREARLPEVSAEQKPAPSAALPEIGGVLTGEVKSVLVSTNVLSDPSYRAPIIGRLREGDKVSVEARVGQWVRIRSRRGKTGFIFAQDIGETDDFRAADGNR
jgi:hypothetical protein